MTIWTVTATNFAPPDGDGADVTLPDFDDGGDMQTLYAHLHGFAAGYASTNAKPQTPVMEPSP